jgi:outer membrane protein TolC
MRISLGLILLALLCCTSCARFVNSTRDSFSRFATKRADKAAYGIVRDKQEEALGKPADLDIDAPSGEATDRLLAQAKRLDLAQDSYTTPTSLISLSDALTIAIANNPDYQTQRESLYASALALTEVRRDYQPLFNGSGNLGATRERDADPISGKKNVEWFGTRGFTAGADWLLATGANVSLDFTHSFVRFFTHEPRPTSSNELAFAVAQPLLRGAGTLVASENLVQGERSMIYTVRGFRRYQQAFVIQVAQEYYALLSAQDQLRNARANYRSTLDNQKKLERYVSVGRVSGIEVDQARQRVLEAEALISSTRKDYGRRLDNFKLFLGLPIDLDVGPDPKELDHISERGLLRPDMSLGDAIRIAQEGRLDLKNQQDQVEDKRRAMRIALRNFLPNLSVNYRFSTSTGEDGDRVKLGFQNNTNSWWLDLGLPFDWTPRRNDYRRATIALNQSQRAFNLSRDQLVLDVRDAWRELDESRVNYRIQLESVRLAERRVTMASRFIQRGTATARDLLEAEDALLASRNSLTSALIQHTLQRLNFWNTIERLDIDEKGMWVSQQGETSAQE